MTPETSTENRERQPAFSAAGWLGENTAMLTEDELKQIEKMIEKHKPYIPSGAGFLTILFLLFLQGCFKGCGY